MRLDATEFRWDSRREKAAVLVAEDEVPDHEIATRCGVNKATLERWKQHPAFRERVAEHGARLEAAALRYAIAKRRKRVEQLDNDLAALNAIQAARAEDPAMAAIPGGATGLILRTIKIIGTGKATQTVEEYTPDTALLKTKAALLKQAAQELGQWSEKRDLTSGGQPVRFTIKIAGRHDDDDAGDV